MNKYDLVSIVRPTADESTNPARILNRPSGNILFLASKISSPLVTIAKIHGEMEG